jgi:hypothetical protein
MLEESLPLPPLPLKLELKPGPELNCMPEVFEPMPPEVVVPALVPLPALPRNAGNSLCPSGSRAGCAVSWAKSITMTRMPNSISRERASDSSVRSAEMRAARYVP